MKMIRKLFEIKYPANWGVSYLTAEGIKLRIGPLQSLDCSVEEIPTVGAELPKVTPSVNLGYWPTGKPVG